MHFILQLTLFPALLFCSILFLTEEGNFRRLAPAAGETAILISNIKKIKTEINKLTLIMIIIKIVIDNDYHF